MRQNQQNKNRMRGRSRKGPNPLTRTFESNGPDVKIRGTALHVAEKYTQLARDASSSGDRVMAENYLQHAEHYYRVIATAQAALQPSTASNRDENADDDADDLEPIGSDRFEPRQIDMRMPNANGQYPPQDRPEREGGVQQGRGDYDRGDRGDRNEPRRDRDPRPSDGYQDRQGGDRPQQDRQGQDRQTQGGQDRQGQDRQQDRQGQDRQGQDRQDRGRDRNERRPRFDRGNFDRRGEREPRPFEPRPVVVTGGPHPMPLDAPQPDVAFPDAVAPAAPSTEVTSAPEAPRSAPPTSPSETPPTLEAGSDKPVRRRRAPRTRKPDGEGAAPEPTAAD